MKKTIAILVVLTLCLAVLPMAVGAEGETYFVAGNAELCGEAWAVDNADNQMTPAGDGTYTKQYPSVPAGTHEFKITSGTWEPSWGDNGQNYKFSVSAPCDVKIIFNPADGSIKVEGANVGAVTNLTVNSINAVGNGSGSWLSGENWNTSANEMNGSGNVYFITYPGVPAGEYKVKFAANGSWTDNWGAPAGTDITFGATYDAVYNSQDITFVLTETQDVTLTLDLTNFTYGDKSGAKFSISVSAPSDTPVEPNPGEGTTPEGNVNVYAWIPESWGVAGVWAWDDNQKNAFSAWPGLAMTKGDDGWWYAEVPAWIQNIIINDNGAGNQTADLDLEQTADMWIVVQEDKSAVVYYSKPDSVDAPPSPTPTPTPGTPQESTPGEEEPADQPQNDTLWIVLIFVGAVILAVGAGFGTFILVKKLRKK